MREVWKHIVPQEKLSVASFLLFKCKTASSIAVHTFAATQEGRPQLLNEIKCLIETPYKSDL